MESVSGFFQNYQVNVTSIVIINYLLWESRLKEDTYKKFLN